jgi:hypothetical protein
MFYAKKTKDGFEFCEFRLHDDVNLVQIFENDDLEKLAPTIERAHFLWEKLTSDYVKENGDQGTCVLGAGIEVLYIAKRTPKLKKLTTKMIIRQPRCSQGATCWEAERLQRVLDYLTENGIENARYNPGRMD